MQCLLPPTHMLGCCQGHCIPGVAPWLTVMPNFLQSLEEGGAHSGMQWSPMALLHSRQHPMASLTVGRNPLQVSSQHWRSWGGSHWAFLRSRLCSPHSSDNRRKPGASFPWLLEGVEKSFIAGSRGTTFRRQLRWHDDITTINSEVGVQPTGSLPPWTGKPPGVPLV